MADSSKFGNPKTQFGDTTASQADNTHCAQCEAMLADALDGTLTAADQATFDTHMLTCGPCGQLLADAKRGHAWLEMLRDPRPEPPETLVEKILTRTSGLVPAVAAGVPIAGMQPVSAPFGQRFWAAIRRGTVGQFMLQPRLAMTAAMAFFSVALTMDLTGMQLKDLNPANLSPSNIRRTYHAANARVHQYYYGLRVVYELESRVHEMESVQGDEAQPAPAQSAPAPKQPAQQPDNKQAPEKKGTAGPRSSSPAEPMRREPGARMSLARYVPGRRDLAELDHTMWDLSTSTDRMGTEVREGRLV